MWTSCIHEYNLVALLVVHELVGDCANQDETKTSGAKSLVLSLLIVRDRIRPVAGSRMRQILEFEAAARISNAIQQHPTCPKAGDPDCLRGV
jgi:hypothetical protein